ncbi:MAG: sugar phosphate isomerase/epimerase [Spirochaetes bacterium]|nr:sugar phosphate isomerase/epimerase [Spirochaetota bacterium]
MKGKIGLQLYSLKEIIDEKSFTEVLKKVKTIGYEGIEGVERDGDPDTVHLFCGKKAQEVRSILDDVGLLMVSNHIGFYDLKKNFDTIVRFHKEIGCNTLVVAGIPGILFKDRNAVRKTVKEMTELSATVSQEGMELALHNCPLNFVSIASYELFAQEAGNALAVQPDAGNARIVGVDPARYYGKLKNRFVSLHIKDGKKGSADMLPLDKGEAGKENENIWNRYKELSTTVGNGDTNIKKFVRMGEKKGISWFIVEEEVTEDPLKTVEDAYAYLASL